MASSTAAGNRKEHTPDARPPRLSKERGTAGPISFFIAMIIVILASIELVSTFHTYAMNLSQLNSLRKQEASLIAQKQELENNINRWNDDAYVTAQARDRLGFVFAGEQAIRVLHPEAVTGTEAANNGGNSGKDSKEDKPWYQEMASAFEKADKGDGTKHAAKNDKSTAGSDGNDGQQ
ncbi:MAG: septum formation initiator family protein [Bifidobacterium crudilactis]|uniref:FtsB family cell division protein n=1 Tax=Bifidobacterium crudilactis TaxID=327277 RepID=UPI002356AA72|nr:septum formation initiator family protein [Bifidobacterium crudilactis]MCI1217689.1 septum formation initiator family protein [Bifidobacterium crudilactis]MCI1637989.1 septum formation initiator family protein [Bifidobacterium crudilactis]